MCMTTHSKMLSKSLTVLCILVTQLTYSQSLSEELPFFNYLLNGRNYDDALLLLTTLNTSGSNELDSLNYYKGKTYYLNQELEISSAYFDKITNTALSFRNEGLFFNAFNKAHFFKYDQSIKHLNSISTQDSLIFGLRNLEIAAISLLKRDYDSFNNYSTSFTSKYYQYSEQEISLMEIKKDLLNHKKRSPLTAGIMSAIIPGAGRIYGGKTGIGIGTFLTSAVFGLQAWEAYRKDGVESARFIIFGSLFSIFYVGNIWGSVFTVKLSNEEFNNAVNHQILVDMHIPLRSIYN